MAAVLGAPGQRLKRPAALPPRAAGDRRLDQRIISYCPALLLLLPSQCTRVCLSQYGGVTVFEKYLSQVCSCWLL